MKAIETRYLGPTDYLGSRIKASDQDRNSVTLSWDYGLDQQPNHERAARALVEKMGWGPVDLHGGSLRRGYVWVMTAPGAEVH